MSTTTSTETCPATTNGHNEVCCEPAETEQRVETPRVDLVEAADEYRLLVNLPGATEDSVDLSVEERLLTVTATVEAPSPADLTPRYREYGPRMFKRQFSLGDGIDTSQVDALMSEGVLQVTLPKSPRAQRQQIAIRRES